MIISFNPKLFTGVVTIQDNSGTGGSAGGGGGEYAKRTNYQTTKKERAKNWEEYLASREKAKQEKEARAKAYDKKEIPVRSGKSNATDNGRTSKSAKSISEVPPYDPFPLATDLSHFAKAQKLDQVKESVKNALRQQFLDLINNPIRITGTLEASIPTPQTQSFLNQPVPSPKEMAQIKKRHFMDLAIVAESEDEPELAQFLRVAAKNL